MKFTTAITLTLATFAMATPMPDEDFSVDARADILEARKSCSSTRASTDICGGKKLQKQNSWHNCNNSGGKCCATNADGSGGMDISKGLGREDCGYCFSAKCKA
ncbi:hypothetical protein PT974_03133 [Cladobotryum mycophilum]|uniref:Uncharacterized protein n=1 Tax=Cladobotryum mycophilum TaxID=491253 RepID=A0ABR0SRF7_9HYPO